MENSWNATKPLVNCEINLILTWFTNCFIVNAPAENELPTFTITDTKLYVPTDTLSTRDSAKLLQQLKSGFKKIINWKKYQSKVIVQEQNRYLDYLTDPGFLGVNRLSLNISFLTYTSLASYKRYYLPKVKIKDYHVIIDRQKIFDQPVKNNLQTYANIRKISTGKGDDYTTICLLDYPYFKNYYKMIAIDLSKQQELDADPKAIQQINFTGNLNWNGNKKPF